MVLFRDCFGYFCDATDVFMNCSGFYLLVLFSDFFCAILFSGSGLFRGYIGFVYGLLWLMNVFLGLVLLGSGVFFSPVFWETYVCSELF